MDLENHRCSQPPDLQKVILMFSSGTETLSLQWMKGKKLIFKDLDSFFFPNISCFQRTEPDSALKKTVQSDKLAKMPLFLLIHLFSATRCLYIPLATCPVTPSRLAVTIFSKMSADNGLMHSFKKYLLRTQSVPSLMFCPSQGIYVLIEILKPRTIPGI